MVKFALPTGDLRPATAALLADVGLGNAGYAAGSRSLRLSLDGAEGATLRVFRERDIPIQIALGNYDLGICGLAALEEMRLRFPVDQIALLRPLPFGAFEVHIASDPDTARRLGPLPRWSNHAGLRIVSDLPTLAEAFALSARLPRVRITPVYGSADAYPPEDAELVIVQSTREALAKQGLESLAVVLSGNACLIANRRSLALRDLSAVLGPLLREVPPTVPHGGGLALPRLSPVAGVVDWVTPPRDPEVLRLAVPDGHQQRHAVESLRAADLEFDGYDENGFKRRPGCGIPGLDVKVIRPQDMPQQVALGNFDLAMTGRDVLHEHLLAFPDSPIEEVVDLRRSPYGIAAAVDAELPAETIHQALDLWHGSGIRSIRIASEFPNIADHYARTRHFGRYQILPVAGASEGFVPEDAEILIEGSETGRSFIANGLRVIDSVFESTNCVIASKRPLASGPQALMNSVVDALRRAVAAPVRG